MNFFNLWALWELGARPLHLELLDCQEKYGDGLSWGDLFIMAGTTAVQAMGGPVTQYCAGRVDSADGKDSGSCFAARKKKSNSCFRCQMMEAFFVSPALWRGTKVNLR